MEEIEEKINGILNSLTTEEGKELLRRVATAAMVEIVTERPNAILLKHKRRDKLDLRAINKQIVVVYIED